MSNAIDLCRYEHPRIVEFRAVLELLRRIGKYAPQVKADLLDRVSSVNDESERTRAVAAWAKRWHLCDREGPAPWAIAIGLDTAKHVPDFGWNLSTFATFPIDAPLPGGYIDGTGIEISLPALSFTWHQESVFTGQNRWLGAHYCVGEANCFGPSGGDKELGSSFKTLACGFCMRSTSMTKESLPCC